MDDKKLDTLFLGTGWSFPPTFSKGDKEISMVSANADIHQSLEILLGTTLGERIMHPDFGCNLNDYLFQPISTTITTIIKDLVKKAILRHESRIDLLDLTLDSSEQQNGLILLELHYSIRTTNARSNYVFPFYLTEGTNT